jgi:hypothetical protein
VPTRAALSADVPGLPKKRREHLLVGTSNSGALGLDRRIETATVAELKDRAWRETEAQQRCETTKAVEAAHRAFCEATTPLINL